MPGTKLCKQCRQEKPSAEFYRHKDTADKLQIYCKACCAEYQRNHRATAETRRRRYLKREYGITVEHFERVLQSQMGMCSVCGSPDPGRQGWHVDHDHASGVVRSILCRFCNIGIGLFKDNPRTLRSAARYIEQAPK